MPGKPRGKGKAQMATMDEVRAAAKATQPLKGERPPTTAEFEAMMKNAGAVGSSSSSSAAAAAAEQKKKAGDQILLHKAGSAKPTNQIGKNTAFIPPGADIQSKSLKNAFLNQFEEHFLLPQRLRKIPTSLVEGVNDFHFAMMNDLPRNEFYYQMLKEHIVPGETTVLEIGAGSGLLSMMAASLGAKWVVAVEGSDEMGRLAQRNIDANKFTDRVRVLNKMSCDLKVSDLPSKPDVLVSEIFGTLLLGESALEYLEDVRKRGILRKDTKILPRFGKQYCCLIECPILEQICGVAKWRDIDLTLMNSLRDTASIVFTKKYGFRMSSVPFKRLTPPIELLSLDFERTCVRDVPIEFSVSSKLLQAGKGHAFLYWWAAWNREEDVKAMTVDEATGAFTGFDQTRVMSTDPEHTHATNFPRDMQWGQALQLVDAGMGPLPKDLVYTADDVARSQDPKTLVCFTCRTSEDRVILQMELDNGDDNDNGFGDDDDDCDGGEYDEEEEGEDEQK